MIILVPGAVGRGPTPLAAFDAALVLLVEHHGGDDVSLRGLVRASLEGLCPNRGVSFPSGGIEVAGARCGDELVCALVVAVFEAAAWASAGRLASAVAWA